MAEEGTLVCVQTNGSERKNKLYTPHEVGKVNRECVTTLKNDSLTECWDEERKRNAKYLCIANKNKRNKLKKNKQLKKNEKKSRNYCNASLNSKLNVP